MKAAAALAAGAAVRRLWRSRHLLPLDGRTVIVTGGARGLGLLLAREFGRHGATVAICSRTPSELENAARDLRGRGIPTHAAPCDVTDREQVYRFVDDVVGTTGRLDVLVNNAGVIAMTPFAHTTPADFERSLATHFWGPLYTILAARPHLRRTRGRILNISSIGGRVSVPHLLPYCAGKFALVGLSEGLRAELAREGIVVTTATPGLMRTGSHLRVQLRGRHEREALFFGAAVATPLTSKNAGRAARELVRACREGRAHATPGIQARLAEIVNIVMPELTAVLRDAATRVLPAPAGDGRGQQARMSHEVGFSWLAPLMPQDAARRNNEVPGTA
ncbi:MAG TPA: SDR family NAD(P)-dependent oxidoreductase [Vicinamibacterales bacterium]